MSKTINLLDLLADINPTKPKRHPKCMGYEDSTPNGTEYGCGYETTITCDDCKYGHGNKNPEAKANQIS
jgi:hypothetical protein